MAAPSTPVIQGVSPVYPFGSNVHATWVTDTSVTSGATTLYSGSTVVSTQAASLFDYDAYTKTWKVSYPIAAEGTYAIGVTSTNGDGTSDEATAQFVVADYSGIVLSPSGTVTGLPINVAWSIDDPNGVAAQNIVIEKSDHSRVLYSSVLQPTQRTLALGSAELAGIEDGASYVILLHVTNGVGLVTTATSTITTSWLPPVTPTATVTTDPDTLAASVTVTGDRTYDFTDVESFTAPESGVITSLTIDGKSVQDGTPTPSTPVAIESVESDNLSPFFSHDLTDIYNASTNPTGYWREMNPGYTMLNDGWVHFECDNTGSGSNANRAFRVAPLPDLVAGDTYTILTEIRNVVSVLASTSKNFITPAYQAYQLGTVAAFQYSTETTPDYVAHYQTVTVSDPTSSALQRGRCYVYAGSYFSADIRMSIYAGEYSGPYTPVGAININSSGTTYPIDLQGHALRSLPDGTHDELTVDSAGVVTLTQRVGETTQAVTDGVTGTVGVDVLSSTGQIANGAQVVYKLATEQTISLGTITPPFVVEGATVAIDAAVTPTFDATMRAAQSAGMPLTDTLMVVRVNPDGTRHVLADDLESGDSVTDPLPPLGVEYSYEVTGIAATGVPSAPATVTHANATTCWAMNFGVGAAEIVLARFNPKASYSMEQGGELYHFADGGEGDGLPVWYGTTEREIGGSVSWDTLTQATADRLNALMLRHPVGWLRDPFGHRWRAHMKPKFSHGIGKLWQVAIDWDAVRWVEA